MARSAPVDGFALAYDRHGAGEPVVLLHGWPGDRTDYDALVPLLETFADVVAPDLRGFGASDKHREPPSEAYSAAAQARSVLGLIDELGRLVPGGLRHGGQVPRGAAARARRPHRRADDRAVAEHDPLFPSNGRIGFRRCSAHWSRNS